MRSTIRLNIEELDRPIEATIQQPKSILTPQEMYNAFRKKHRMLDFIPQNNIDYLIRHHFGENSSILYSYSDSEKIMKIKVENFLRGNVVNWHRNREPDKLRIPAISQHIYQSKKIFRTQIYLNYNFKTDQFEIIDGLHRYLSLNLLFALHSGQESIAEETNWYNSNEDLNWFYNSDLIVHCTFHSIERELEEIRENINCSQPMPMVLQNDRTASDLEKISIINNIATEWQNKYKRNFADSDNDTYLRTIASTNRNKFIKLLASAYDKHSIDVNKINILRQLLNHANEYAKERVLSGIIKCNDKIKQRCQESGCYLFILKNSLLEDII